MSSIKDAVLVLTTEEDVTADIVIQAMLERDVPVVKFDTGTFPAEAEVTVTAKDGLFAAILTTATDEVDLQSLRSVWYRRPTEFSFEAGMEADTVPFARAEARQGLSGALLTSSASWMNPPQAESIASFKLVQLKAASAAGLAIPETLVTNTPEDARGFLQDHEGTHEAIYKRLSNQFLFTEEGRLTAFHTEKVDAAARARLDQVAVTPCLFQSYVAKAYEIRATVVGDKVYAARVFSQESTVGQTDWRADHDLKWEAYALPPSVEQQVVETVSGLGLVFGAVDLIRHPDGTYVFLEVNPSGQWAWFDDDVTLPIRDAVIEFLTAFPAATQFRSQGQRLA